MKALLGAMLISVFFISTFAPMAIASTAPTLTTHPRIVIGNVESTNWSGYAVTGSSVSAAEGSWVVPSVTCPSRGSTYAAFWVGIDGYSSDTVEQTGVLAQCSNGAASYLAWYEFYPAAMVTISVTISPGDKISAAVTYVSGSTFRVTLADTTTKATYSTTGSVSGAARSSAEWVVERPEVCSGFRCQLTTLANFGTAEFGYDNTGVSGTCYATIGTVTGQISGFSTSTHTINMVSSSGSTLDTTSSLSIDGTSFTVTYG